MTLTQYVAGLDQMGLKLRKQVMEAQRTATIAAVNKAIERTAPNDGIARGSNVVTGNMSRHWQTDSKVDPVDEGSKMTTELNCNVDYASYVNDGHWLYRHFVPGLYIDENGLISKTFNPGVGLIVAKDGKKWVPGRYMETDAIEEYRYVLKNELAKIHLEVGGSDIHK